MLAQYQEEAFVVPVELSNNGPGEEEVVRTAHRARLFVVHQLPAFGPFHIMMWVMYTIPSAYRSKLWYSHLLYTLLSIKNTMR